MVAILNLPGHTCKSNALIALEAIKSAWNRSPNKIGVVCNGVCNVESQLWDGSNLTKDGLAHFVVDKCIDFLGSEVTDQDECEVKDKVSLTLNAFKVSWP